MLLPCLLPCYEQAGVIVAVAVVVIYEWILCECLRFGSFLVPFTSLLLPEIRLESRCRKKLHRSHTESINVFMIFFAIPRIITTTALRSKPAEGYIVYLLPPTPYITSLGRSSDNLETSNSFLHYSSQKHLWILRNASTPSNKRVTFSCLLKRSDIQVLGGMSPAR